MHFTFCFHFVFNIIVCVSCMNTRCFDQIYPTSSPPTLPSSPTFPSQLYVLSSQMQSSLVQGHSVEYRQRLISLQILAFPPQHPAITNTASSKAWITCAVPCCLAASSKLTHSLQERGETHEIQEANQTKCQVWEIRSTEIPPPPRSSGEEDWLAEFQTGDLPDLVSYLQPMQKASDLQLS